MSSHKCRYCQEEKPRSEFYPRDQKKPIDKYKGCTPCESEELHRRTFKMTKTEYADQMHQQGNKCIICSDRIIKQTMITDRDAGGELRGIFCSKVCFQMIEQPSTQKKCVRGVQYLMMRQMQNESLMSAINELLLSLDKMTIQKEDWRWDIQSYRWALIIRLIYINTAKVMCSALDNDFKFTNVYAYIYLMDYSQ